MTRPTQALIDTDAFHHNYQVARQYAPNSRVMAMVKANGYGHGAVQLARAVPDADGFGVISTEEAMALRESGIEQPLLLLEGFFEAGELEIICRNRLDTVIHCQEQVEQLLKTDLSSPLDIWLKLDTGMHRLGLPPESLIAAYTAIKSSGKAKSIRLMTHLACADDPDKSETVTAQVNCLQQNLKNLLAASSAFPEGLETSLANSAAVVAHPAAHGDWVRPGIMLYGVNPMVAEHEAARQLKPVMTLSSKLIAVRDVPAGEYVGYGHRWQAQKPSRIGTVAIGYGDGYPRHAVNGTPVLVNGRRALLSGRVSMDLLTVDLSNMPDARIGDPVVLWGQGLPVWDVAQQAGTIGYELLAKVTPRVPRIYR